MKKQFVIKYSECNYYDFMTTIGPKFGVSKEKAKRFDSEYEARCEMSKHYAFCLCDIEEIKENE